VNTFPDRPYIVDLNPKELWNCVCETLQDCVGWAGSDKIACVATTSQRFTTVVIDAAGETKAICPNIDARGIEVSDGASDPPGEVAFKITGHYPSFLFSFSRVKWFKEFQPALFDRIKYVTTIDGWLCHQITGSPAEEPSQAAGTMLFDIRRRGWSEEMCKMAGISSDWLPRLENFGGFLGYPTDRFQAITGISRRTPVVMGAGDTHCSGIGSSVLSNGQLHISMGSTAPVHLITSKPILDEKRRIWTGCFPIDGQWVLESNSGICGLAYEWVASLILSHASSGPIDHELYERLAKSAPPCSRDLFTFLGPRVMDASSFTKISPSAIIFTSLLMGQKPGAAELARACLEEIAYAIRGNIEQLGAVTAIMDQYVRAAGGMTNSGLILQILADVLSRPLLVPREKRASAVGCAVAGISFLDSKNPRSVVSEVIKPIEIKPSGDSARYSSAYKRWKFIYERLFDLL
jgi:autoinducer 2 (AI-2) kinase